MQPGRPDPVARVQVVIGTLAAPKLNCVATPWAPLSWEPVGMGLLDREHRVQRRARGGGAAPGDGPSSSSLGAWSMTRRGALAGLTLVVGGRSVVVLVGK